MARIPAAACPSLIRAFIWTELNGLLGRLAAASSALARITGLGVCEAAVHVGRP